MENGEFNTQANAISLLRCAEWVVSEASI